MSSRTPGVRAALAVRRVAGRHGALMVTKRRISRPPSGSRTTARPRGARRGDNRRFAAAMAQVRRPVPFRTRKLRPGTAMVLHSTGCGRVARRRITRDWNPGRAPKAPGVPRIPPTGALPAGWRGPPRGARRTTNKTNTKHHKQNRHSYIHAVRMVVSMHYFMPRRCPTSNKIMYHDKIQAQRAADNSFVERGAELWVYQCEYCGCWHLTHSDPSARQMRITMAKGVKPHSRKRGYKPRRR